MTSPSLTQHDATSPPPDARPERPDRPEGPVGASPMRPATRFPAGQRAAGGPGPARVRWTGPDGRLRDLVRDHATAAGIELVDAAADDPVTGELIEGSSLLDGDDDAVRAPVPLLAVTADGTVAPEVWQAALARGAQALVQLPSGSERLLTHLAALARPRISASVIGVAGGCGGAGASSFSARLAGAARAHGPVTLVDADPLGGGLDVLVEEPGARGIGWADAAGLGADDGDALREGLPSVDDVRLLVAGDGPGPDATAVSRVLTMLSPLGGTVVVDLGAALVPAAIPHLDHLLLLVPGTDHAVRAAGRRLAAWQPPAALTELVVRRSGPLSPEEVAEDLALPRATAFRDSARGAVPLLDVRRRGADRACRRLAAGLLEAATS